MYSGPKHPHYFGLLYPLYYVIISYFIAFSKSSWEKYLTILFLAGFIFLNFQNYPYFRNPSNNQITSAKNISQKIYDNVKDKKFTVTALPEKYSDSTYRYFLEIWGKRSLEKIVLKKLMSYLLFARKNAILLSVTLCGILPISHPIRLLGSGMLRVLKYIN